MRPLSSSQLLRVWEDGLGQSLEERTFRLLGEACNTHEFSSVSQISIGERDARLLLLREWMFGKQLQNMARCPVCSQITEWEASTEELHLQVLPEHLSVRTFSLEKDGYVVNFRLPDSNDIAKATMEGKNDERYRMILSACIQEADHNGKKITVDQLPEPILEQINQRMGEEDPQADIRMNIKCPSCQHIWEARFDIVSFLWAEINSWAQRILREICLLAKNFGWREADILNMNPHRRQIYLQLLGA